MMASPMSQAEWAISTILSATCAVPNATSWPKVWKWPRSVTLARSGRMPATMSKVGATKRMRIRKSCHCAASAKGSSVQAVIDEATQKIGVRVRRRLSIIFQRETAGTPLADPKMKGRSCQSPLAQR